MFYEIKSPKKELLTMSKALTLRNTCIIQKKIISLQCVCETNTIDKTL